MLLATLCLPATALAEGNLPSSFGLHNRANSAPPNQPNKEAWIIKSGCEPQSDLVSDELMATDCTPVPSFCIKAFGEPLTEPVTFIDVDELTAHEADIFWLASAGISEGWMLENETREFRPYSQIARADMAAFLFRLARNWGLVEDSWTPTGAKSFTDVSEQTAHHREIVWLAESGISEGWKHDDGTSEFRPYANIARADMAAFIARLHCLCGGTIGGQGNFTDVDHTTAHAADIRWLAAAGISEGWKSDDGTAEFRPYAFVARADMAAFLHRMHNLELSNPDFSVDELEVSLAD